MRPESPVGVRWQHCPGMEVMHLWKMGSKHLVTTTLAPVSYRCPSDAATSETQAPMQLIHRSWSSAREDGYPADLEPLAALVTFAVGRYLLSRGHRCHLCPPETAKLTAPTSQGWNWPFWPHF